MTKEIKAGKKTQKSVQCPAKADKATQEAAERPFKKTDRKTPVEPYKNILEFPETRKISLFNNKNYYLSVSIRLSSSWMRPIVCVFETGAGPIIIQADVLVPCWLESVHHRDMLDFRSAHNTKLKLSGTTIFHHRMRGAGTTVDFGAVSKLDVSVLLEPTYTDRFTKSIHPSERTAISYHSPPLPVLTIHKASTEAIVSRCSTRQDITEAFAPLLKHSRYDSQYITVAQKVVLQTIYAALVLVSTQAACLIDVLCIENEIKLLSCIMAKIVVKLYRSRSFYHTFAHFSKAQVNLSNH